MSEAERLQKIVTAQELELKRIRKLLSFARIAQADFYVDGEQLCVVVSCIGADEYHFIEHSKTALESIASAIIDAKVTTSLDGARNTVTGEPLEGGVAPK